MIDSDEDRCLVCNKVLNERPTHPEEVVVCHACYAEYTCSYCGAIIKPAPDGTVEEHLPDCERDEGWPPRT